MLHTKMEEKTTKRKTQNQIDRKKYRKNIEIKGEIQKKYKKRGNGRIETTGDFSLIADPYIWKRLKNDDNGI